MFKILEGRAGRLVVNEAHLPIIVVHWEGKIDAELLQDYFSWKLKRLQGTEDRGQFVLVHDLSIVHRPSATLRSLANRKLQETRPLTNERTLRNIAVVNNPVIRGVLRAMSWVINGRVADIHRTLPQALEDAKMTLISEGIMTPPNLNPQSYVSPSPHSSGATSGTARSVGDQ